MKAKIPSTNLPRILIIGGGFGGIKLAQTLNKQSFQVVLVDRNNYHTFQPLLYQVATGGLEPDSIAFPLRKMFSKQENLIFRMCEVEKIDHSEKRAHTNIGYIEYDYLVMATGSETNFFGMEELESNALGMKTILESVDLRSLILMNFEQSLQEATQDDREVLLKFVVVGGGPTGVETAGALAELKKHVLPSDYPELDLRQMEIHLIQAGSQLLEGMSEKSSQDALDVLEKMGVNIWLNHRVTGYDGEKLSTKEGRDFEASTVIWAAGVKGDIPLGIDTSFIGRGYRLKVNEYNEVDGLEGVYAVGDVAYMETEAYPNGHPQVAQVAIQQGEILGKNLRRKYKGAPLKAFKYYDKGSMATIGRNKAVVDLKNMHLKGRIAWFAWMFVHLLFLIGFRNKMVVFANWVWSYFTYDKGTRVILRPYKKKNKRVEVTLGN
ncbi:MAG: NAD(P)/FAD-dependent oxidoreductase [Bacteroidota bacterium]